MNKKSIATIILVCAFSVLVLLSVVSKKFAEKYQRLQDSYTALVVVADSLEANNVALQTKIADLIATPPPLPPPCEPAAKPDPKGLTPQFERGKKFDGG